MVTILLDTFKEAQKVFSENPRKVLTQCDFNDIVPPPKMHSADPPIRRIYQLIREEEK